MRMVTRPPLDRPPVALIYPASRLRPGENNRVETDNPYFSSINVVEHGECLRDGSDWNKNAIRVQVGPEDVAWPIAWSQGERWAYATGGSRTYRYVSAVRSASKPNVTIEDPVREGVEISV